MAPIKRKPVTEERPHKKPKITQSDPAKKPDGKSQDDEPTQRRPLAKSLLQQEERAFPRGGASVLTPLEHKQIKAQAERDVLFESQTGRKAPAKEDGDGDLFDEETTTRTTKKKSQPHQKRAQSHGDAEKVERSGVKIQSLSYKNLAVGSAVLGYVTAITDRDVALALANNLTGYVPITAISERLNVRIQKLLAADAGEAEHEEDDVDLKRIFHVGQWLRATVTSTGSDSAEGNGGGSGKNKRHIELSIDPSQVNGHLDVDAIVTNSMLQAAVRSVEDHGLIMDLGLSDSDTKGFVSKKELGAAYAKLEDVQEGQVMLCLVTGRGSNGKVLKLSPDAARFSVPLLGGGNKNTGPFVTEAPTVDSFQPGIAVEVLITEASAGGVMGKVMGMLDVTADVVHSGARALSDLSERYKVGSKVKGRIVWSLPAEDGSRRIGVSLLEHMLYLPPPERNLPENASVKLRAQAKELEDQRLPLSSIIEDAKVTHVLAERGVFMTLPFPSKTEGTEDVGATAFAHISQLSDTRIDTLLVSSGAYRLDSTHRARIISYNPLDDLYYVSLKESVLEQAFLRIEDLTIGETVTGNIERLILGAKGVTGVLVKLSENVSGLVPAMHLSDVEMRHPERKFKEGVTVRARVLSVDVEKRHVRLTLKKSLLTPASSEDETDEVIWKDYAELRAGMEGKGTIVNLLPNGAAVQFFGSVRAWLPVAEFSEAFVEKPQEYFRLGQTVRVRILEVEGGKGEMKVSCTAVGSSDGDGDAEREAAWEGVRGGDVVAGTVTEKTAESVTVELDNGLKGLLRVGHLSDGSAAKAASAMGKIHVGQRVEEMVVLGKMERSRQVVLSRKPSLLSAVRAGELVRSLQDVQVGKQIYGFVRNTTSDGIFVEFAMAVVGLLPKSQVAPEMLGPSGFGLFKDQSIGAWVLNVDADEERFVLSMREPREEPTKAASVAPLAVGVTNPADPTITSSADFTLGRVTKARIASVKSTQLNVRLADGVQGRVDVSEVFDEWSEVGNKKAPLQKWKPNEVIEVKILGVHDARNHRFLPISHRENAGTAVFELSARRARIEGGDVGGLDMGSLKVGEKRTAFINNHSDNCVWVTLSPNVRGRIALMDLSEDVGQLHNLEKHFPVGSALQVTVKSVDPVAGRLDLTAKATDEAPLTLQDVSVGMILAARVTKVSERSVTVQLSETLAAPIPLVELGDDYDNLNLGQYKKNDIVRVCVTDIDLPNKKLFLSTRPSKVLSSSLPVPDVRVSRYEQLKPGQVVRGFVKRVAEKGVWVMLGARVDGFVRISDLSDQYVKDWKSIVEVDQLVKGRIVSVDVDGKNVLMSLKASHVDENFKPPVTINDLKRGDVVTGKVRKVEDFGAFIDIDNTQPRLSGLCHRSEVAEKRVEDVREVYEAGDVVKAVVLSVDVEKRKISLGLKASYFVDEVEVDDVDGEGDVEVDGTGLGAEDDDAGMDILGGVDLGDVRDLDSEDESSDADEMDLDETDDLKPSAGLKTTGFDWTGEALDTNGTTATSDSEPDAPASKKRRRHKPEIKVDMTGDLDKYGPRSVSDFERQLLGQPNDSALWVQYMAFQLQLSEIEKAREIAQRALRTIHIRETEEKANVWIAWLNLEVEYGDEDRVGAVFKQACQVQDSLEMHEKLASIYIDSGKHDKADALFEKIVGNKAFRASPDVWLNYASFLMETLKAPLKARGLLAKALKSVPANEHRHLTAKFAALEFRSVNGDAERGRTIFEGLVSEWPKWSGGWDMWADLERSRIAHAGSTEAKGDAKEKVRALYERVAGQKMKKRRARFVFKRWLEFEEAESNAKGVERVKALAKEYVEGLQGKGGEEMEE